jgi:hypothetical protein
MKIVDFVVNKKSYQTVSVREDIAKDENGNVILERGRPTTVKKTSRSVRFVYEFLYLVESGSGVREWMREGSIVKKFGKRSFKGQLAQLVEREGGKLKMLGMA